MDFKSDFCISHLNVRGLTTKTSEIELLVSKHKFKIFCLSETFLGDHYSNSIYRIPNYTIVRKDRKFGGGGGLLCHIHNSINFKVIDLPSSNADKDCILLKIIPKISKPFLVLFVYRSPCSSSEWNVDFKKYVEECYDINDEIIILGDFNINLLNRKLSNSWISKVCNPLSLNQLIKEPTRVTPTSSTLIDHIYTNRLDHISFSGVIDYSISDHNLIYLVRKIGVKRDQRNYNITFRQFSKFTPDLVSMRFSNILWNDVLCEKDCDVMISKFNQKYIGAVSDIIPVKKRLVKSECLPKWLDKDVQNQIKFREFLKKANRWDEYKKQRNLVTNLIKRKKRQCIAELIRSSKPGDTSSVWRALKLNKSKVRNVETNLSADDLNQHFTSIAAKLTSKYKCVKQQSVKPLPMPTLCNFPRFTPFDIAKYLNSVPNSKACGLDSISVRMLKQTIPFISSILTDMFNRILVDGVFPKIWKTARVTPIFKGGDQNNPSNYRPISVLPILSKLFEKHINIHLFSHLDNIKFLHKYQNGFRKGFSCTHSVHKLITECIELKRRNEKVALIFLDFRKAFDCVSYKILFHKLQLAGIGDNALHLLTSYFDDRSQNVHMNQDISSTLPIRVGVPQGSLIAPTLFLIYINDLLKLDLTSTCFAYADDTVFLNHHKSANALEYNCNKDMGMINIWCVQNRMIINMEKSHFLLFNSNDDMSLNFDSDRITRKHETRLLGFDITNKLRWNKHVENISRKVSRSVTLLHLCRPYLNTKTSLLFYHQFIFCHFIYGIHLYYNLSPKYVVNDLFLLQKRAFRIIANLHRVPYYLVRTNDLSNSLQLMTLPTLNNYFTSIIGHKIFHNQCPAFLCDNFIFDTCHTFNFRDNYKLHTRSINFLDNVIPTTFNNVPLSFRKLSNLKLFKSRLSNLLMSPR